jgi:CheY-like chemotaxis protein
MGALLRGGRIVAMTAILVVDDDTDIRLSLHALLEGEGHRVLEAACGDEALDLLRRSPEHFVVLFDNIMPNGDGTDLLDAVAREDDLERRHVFICMAASPRLFSARLQALLRDLGVPCVGKPFDLDELLGAIDKADRGLAARSGMRADQRASGTDEFSAE